MMRIQINDIVDNDAYARTLGLTLVIVAAAVGVFVTKPQISAVLTHQPVMVMQRGVVAAPVLLAYIGIIYLLAGKNAPKFLGHPSHPWQGMTRLQLVTLILGIVLCVGLEFAWGWVMTREGYVRH